MRSRSQSKSFDERAARNSKGVKEELLISPMEGEDIGESRLAGKDSRQLAIYFSLMVFIGLGNKIFNKLQTVSLLKYCSLSYS